MLIFQMRKEKDDKITDLEKQILAQQAAYDRQIDDLKIEVKSKKVQFTFD